VRFHPRWVTQPFAAATHTDGMVARLHVSSLARMVLAWAISSLSLSQLLAGVGAGIRGAEQLHGILVFMLGQRSDLQPPVGMAQQ
jgi:hypothetical protein